MATKIIKSAKELIAGNFANYHRYGWKEVQSSLDNKSYFVHQQDIKAALQSALDDQSLDQLNQIMINYNIQSVYPLPTISLLS